MNLLDIWPKGVGYNFQSGYNSEKYRSDRDPIEKVQLLVDSWKSTASNHGFSCADVLKLSCKPCDGGHRLKFLNRSTEVVKLKSELQTVKVSADVYECPEDTCVNIDIFGRNLATGKDFQFSLSVYRRPTVTVSTQYVAELSVESSSDSE